jgi:hypothetical protein
MKFILESVDMTRRYTEPRLEELPGMSKSAKHEEITMTVKMVGSGYTKEFTSQEVLKAVMNQLRTIEPRTNNK